MKKIICLALSLLMAVGVMAGCSSETDNSSSVASTSDNSQVSSTPEVSEPEVSEPEVSEPEVSEPEVDTEMTAESANDRLGMIIDSARTAEDVEGFPVQTTNEQGALDYLGLTEEDVEEYAMAYSMMSVHAYQVAVVKPAEGKEEVVDAALKSFHESTVKNFENYLPDQLEIAENAVIENQDGYYILVMCENSDYVADGIKLALKSIDDIKIVVPEADEATGEVTNSDETTTDRETADEVADTSDTAAGDVNADEATESETLVEDENAVEAEGTPVENAATTGTTNTTNTSDAEAE